MASLDDLSTALRNADAAGDTEAATTLANAIKSMQGTAPRSLAGQDPNNPMVSRAPGSNPNALPFFTSGEDVAKSVGSGVVRGAAGVATAPLAARKGLEFVAGLPFDAVDSLLAKLGISQPTEDQRRAVQQHIAGLDPVGNAYGAVSDKMNSAMDANLHQPESQVGNFAQGATEMATGSALMGGPAKLAVDGVKGLVRALPSEVVKGGIVPQAAVTATGALTDNNPLAMTAAAVASGTGANALSRSGTAAQALKARLPKGMNSADVDAAQTLIDNGASRGVTVTWPEALAQVTNGKVDLTDVQRLLETSKDSRPIMTQAIGDRPAQTTAAGQEAIKELTGRGPAVVQPGAASDAIGQILHERAVRQFGIDPNQPLPNEVGLRLMDGMSPQEFTQLGLEAQARARQAAQAAVRQPVEHTLAGTQVQDIANNELNGIRQDINAVAKPHYDAAERVTVPAAEAARLQSDKLFSGTLAEIRADPALSRNIAGLPDNSVGVINAVQKRLQQKAENAGSKFNPQKDQEAASQYGKVATDAKGVAKKSSTEFGKALQIEADLRSGVLDPTIAGPLGGMAKTANLSDQAKLLLDKTEGTGRMAGDAIRRIAAHNPGLAEQIVETRVRDIFNQKTAPIQSGGNPWGAAGFAAALGADTPFATNLATVVRGLPGGAARWNGFRDFLQVLEATGKRQRVGSPTQGAQAMERSLSQGGLVGEGAATALSPQKLLSVAVDKYQSWKLGRNTEELARILTDPASGPLFTKLLRSRSLGERGMIAAQIANIGRVAQGEAPPQPAQ